MCFLAKYYKQSLRLNDKSIMIINEKKVVVFLYNYKLYNCTQCKIVIILTISLGCFINSYFIRIRSKMYTKRSKTARKWLWKCCFFHSFNLVIFSIMPRPYKKEVHRITDCLVTNWKLYQSERLLINLIRVMVKYTINLKH